MLTNNVNDAAKKKKQTGMFLNRLWADWQKYFYCYLSGTVIENQLYSAETHCDQSPGNEKSLSKTECNASMMKRNSEKKLSQDNVAILLIKQTTILISNVHCSGLLSKQN